MSALTHSFLIHSNIRNTASEDNSSLPSRRLRTLSYMIRVNTAYVTAIFGNVAGLADFDNVKPELDANLGPDVDNETIHYLISKYVAPRMRFLLPDHLEEAKLAIRYLLTFAPELADRVLPSILASFPAPRPAHLMFTWIWEESFPGEPWELDRSLEYKVVHDPDQTHTWMTVDGEIIPSPFIGEEFRVDWRTSEQ
jgi:hypothetical protein